MKYFWLILFLFVLAGCSNNKRIVSSKTRTLIGDPSKRIKPEFQSILDSSNVDGSILVYDPQQQLYYSNNFKWAATGKLPASTFKIPNSIIALETGIVEDENSIFKWKGEKRKLTIWERDLNFREAFHLSCVPCYQEIARKIGPKRMKEFLSKFDYGNMVVDSNTIDVFWLEGESVISQFQQIGFLKRFYDGKLPVSDRTQKIMKAILITDRNDANTISGKTGWSIRNGNNNGWFVGYVESGGSVYYFAINVEPRKAFDMDMFPMIRKKIGMKALKALGIIMDDE